MLLESIPYALDPTKGAGSPAIVAGLPLRGKGARTGRSQSCVPFAATGSA